VVLEENELQRQEESYTVIANSYENHFLEYLTESGINLIRIHQFNATEGSERLKTLVKRSLQRDKYLVLDLRYCPGGSLYEVVDAVSLFLPADLEVSYLRKSGTDKLRTLTSLPGRIVNRQRLYLWVSPFTASSAEIFARILRYYATNAVIIGTPTQGKCLSQQTFELEDGSGLELSTFEVLGPDKQPCEGTSIQPDIEVELNEILNPRTYFKLSILSKPGTQRK
jgi:C-terminal processing protease CtpA/Prc